MPQLGAPLPRRTLLLGSLAGLGAALTACGSPAAPAAPPPPSSPAPEKSSAEAALAALETSFGGRIGVYAIDTGTGATVGHRAAERFLMCSTHKALLVAAVLRQHEREPALLDKLIRYDRSQVLEYAPVTSKHVDDGMTVSALCDAALTLSDNTAANLLHNSVGGPAGSTAFVRTLGDQVTRLDRLEPELNVTTPGDERDTTTPAQIAADLRALILGDALAPASRELLTGWMKANTTGAKQVRAGVPATWQVADKTGSGSQGESNDIAIVWPPNRAPLAIAVYTSPTDPKSKAGPATIAAATKIATQALTP